MGSQTPDYSEKENVQDDQVQDVADGAVSSLQSATGVPAEFAHLDEKKILRKVCSLAQFSSLLIFVLDGHAPDSYSCFAVPSLFLGPYVRALRPPCATAN